MVSKGPRPLVGAGQRPARRRQIFSLWFFVFSAILLFLPPCQVRADDGDHDRVRAAVESGQIRPLAEILDRVRVEFPGEVIDVELEEGHQGRRHRGGVPPDAAPPPIIYEIKVRTAEGRILKLHYDAVTGGLRSARGR